MGALISGITITAINATECNWKYPVAPTTNQVDEFFGVKVPDPYRWMEDNSSEDLGTWITEENKITSAYLKSIPERENIRARLTKLYNYERFGTPFKEGNRYFISHNNGLQNQSVLYTMDSLDGEMRMLIDPNTLSTDGTVALSGLSVSENGKWMAYGLSASGSDWQEWRVRDVATGKDTQDHLEWIKFSSAEWRRDGSGFFYCRYDKPDDQHQYQASNENQKIYFHKLGDKQEKDELIYARPDAPKQNFGVEISQDDRYLIIYAHTGTAPLEEISILDLKAKAAGEKVEPLCILPGFDADYRYIYNEGTKFWFFTDYQSPRARIIVFDCTAPQKENWKTIIPQAEETLLGVSLVNNRIVAHYLKDATSQVKIFNLQGKLIREVCLPGIGTASGFWDKKNERETFYSFTSFTTPGTIYRYDMQTGVSSIYKKATSEFKSEQYETKQIFYPSKDGTKIPMFIVYKKGLELNGKNPTLLYGYGGFNISMRPGFSVKRALWMEMGGVLAVANLRGGGEYGEEWHQQGIKLKKQNVFDDFISAAEWLIDHQYTSTEKLVIEGGSNGGLLVGACLLQRPDLFGAAVPEVGVMDMLRYHLFTIGWAWHSDYGLVDNEDEFHALRAYSPVHNIKKGIKYPATFITTADHDDRVVPAHSFKFAAALQAAQAGSEPILIRIETKAGHSAGKPISKRIEESTDVLSFMVHELNFKPSIQ